MRTASPRHFPTRPSLLLVHNLPADDRHQDLCLSDAVALLRVKDVAREHDAIAEVTRSERAALFLLKAGVGAAPGVGSQRLFHRDLLLREPALGVFAVKRAAVDRGIDP